MMYRVIVYKVENGRYNEIFRRLVFADNTSKCREIVKATFTDCKDTTVRIVNTNYYPIAEFKM